MTHNINEIREQAQDLMQELINETGFGAFLKGNMTWHDWFGRARHNGYIPSHIRITSGCTRMVFWDEDNCDYVFKLNIYPDEIDYGASEVFIYERACDAHIEQCFAWTAKVIDDEKFPIYAMAFCKVDSYMLSNECYNYQFNLICEDAGYDPKSLTYEQRDEVNDSMGDYSDTDGMLDYAHSIYDDDTFYRLYDFLEAYDVNDVHCGNWGYYKGQLVLTDYAGYERDLIKRAKENAA